MDTNVKRGEIYYADLSPVVGSEQGGVRPVLIVQNDTGNRHSPTVIAAAITSQMGKAKLPTHIEVAAQCCGLPKDSVILLEQIRTLDKRRLRERMDGVTWAPLSRGRLRERGYDQARLLAESACRLWETKPLPLLRKTVHNPAQSGLKEAAARRANVLGVYEAVDPERISGHRILLVDDICTTGATLAECARVLREAGAADVVCAAAALTPLERDSGQKA